MKTILIVLTLFCRANLQQKNHQGYKCCLCIFLEIRNWNEVEIQKCLMCDLWQYSVHNGLEYWKQGTVN